MAFMETHQRDAFLSWDKRAVRTADVNNGRLGEEGTAFTAQAFLLHSCFYSASIKGEDASSNACLITGTRQLVSGAIVEFPFPQMREHKTTEELGVLRSPGVLKAGLVVQDISRGSIPVV